MMQYWLVKSEPEVYSWDKFVSLGQDMWDGVRNFAARNHLRDMKLGDLVLFYHSGGEKQVVGLAKVVKEHYPDPTSDDPRWLVTELSPVEKLKKPVTLAQIKAVPELQEIALVRIGRLSVMPLKPEHFDRIIAMSAQ